MMSGGIIWILALGVLLYFMMRGGGCCGGHDHGGHDHDSRGGGHDHHDDDHAHQRIGTIGQTGNLTEASVSSRDPVCGMTVASGLDSPKSEHLGRIFYFCSERCRKLFDLNPGKYVQSVHTT